MISKYGERLLNAMGAICIAAGAFMTYVFVVAYGWAQDDAAAVATGFAVDATSLRDWVLEILAAIIMALASVGLSYLARKLKLDGDATIRAYVMAAISSGVTYGINKAKSSTDDLVTFEVQSEIVATAAQYALNNVPTGLKRLGVTKEKLVEIAERMAQEQLGEQGVPVAAPPAA